MFYQFLAGLFSFLFFSIQNVQAKEPIVFIHGLGVPGLIYEAPFSMKDLFAKWGYQLYVTRNPIAVKIHIAVKKAAEDIKRMIPKGKFHIIGHSQGGLTARALAHLPEFQGRILSITTVSTPHLGTQLADRIFEMFQKDKENHEKASKLPAWAQDILEKCFGGNIDAVIELRTENMRYHFNKMTPNVAGIRYFSLGHFVPKPEWDFTNIDILAGAAIWMRDLGEGPNDGLVGTFSSRWGEHLGDFPGDHWAETYPTPFNGKIIVGQVLKRVVDNLNLYWP